MIFIPEDEKKDDKKDKKDDKKKPKVCPTCGKPMTEEKKTDSQQEPDPRIDTILEFLKSEVSKKTDSDTSKWNLDELFGAYRVIGSIKKDELLADAPKIKTDSRNIPEWAKRHEGKALGDA